MVSSHTTTRNGSGVAGLAAAVTSSVWVRGLGHCNTLCILEAIIHEPTIAAAVCLGAIHKLLLAHAGQSASANLPSSLKATNGGECPARATLSLVFHRGHSTL